MSYTITAEVEYPEDSMFGKMSPVLRMQAPRIEAAVRVPDGLCEGDWFELQTSANSRSVLCRVQVPPSCMGGSRFRITYNSFNEYTFAEVPCGLDFLERIEAHQAHARRRLEEECENNPLIAKAFEQGQAGDYELALCNALGYSSYPGDDMFLTRLCTRFRLGSEARHFATFNKFATHRFVQAVDAGRAKVSGPEQEMEYAYNR
jgi:hypothetical protein